MLTGAVTCFGYEGIDAVKEALRTAEAKNTPDNQVKVKLVSPPLYGKPHSFIPDAQVY